MDSRGDFGLPIADCGFRISDLKARCWMLDTRCSIKIYFLLLTPDT